MSDEVQNIDDPELRKLLNEALASFTGSLQSLADEARKAGEALGALGEAFGRLGSRLEAALDAMIEGDAAAPPT